VTKVLDVAAAGRAAVRAFDGRDLPRFAGFLAFLPIVAGLPPFDSYQPSEFRSQRRGLQRWGSSSKRRTSAVALLEIDFFPPRGDAKANCDGCLVQSECPDTALAQNERFGVWGSTGPDDRKKLRRQRLVRSDGYRRDGAA